MQNLMGQQLNGIEDWSELPENQMVKKFQPGKKREKTPVLEILYQDGVLKISHSEEGASLGYQLDDGPWKLYSGEVRINQFKIIRAKAVRYGWEESEVVKYNRE